MFLHFFIYFVNGLSNKEITKHELWTETNMNWNVMINGKLCEIELQPLSCVSQTDDNKAREDIPNIKK